MIASLSEYCGNVMMDTFQKWFLQYRTPSNVLKPIKVVGSFTDEPSTIPEVWVEGEFPERFEFHTFPQSGTNVFQITEETLRVGFGVRASSRIERNSMLDVLAANLLLGRDPESGLAYRQLMWTTYGVVPHGIVEVTRQERETSAFGRIWEAQGIINVHTQVTAEYTYPTINQIKITMAPQR